PGAGGRRGRSSRDRERRGPPAPQAVRRPGAPPGRDPRTGHDAPGRLPLPARAEGRVTSTRGARRKWYPQRSRRAASIAALTTSLWRRATATASLPLLLAACTLVKGRTAAAPSGTITVGLPTIGSLDPADATTPGALTILRTACDSLVGQDPSTGELKPALAQSWTVDPGGRGLVVRLKPGARYHDGSPVAPSGVAEQLSDVAQAGGASQAARELAGVLGHPGDQGAGSLRVVEDGQIRIELPQAFAGLPVLLANPALAPVS